MFSPDLLFNIGCKRQILARVGDDVAGFPPPVACAERRRSFKQLDNFIDGRKIAKGQTSC